MAGVVSATGVPPKTAFLPLTTPASLPANGAVTL